VDTKQLIQASAEVITITSFKAGDVYKRVEQSGYADPSLRYGIVQSVMNNGSDSAFSAIELRPDYSAGVVVETKVFDGSKPAALFAAEPNEVAIHLDEVRKSVEQKRDAAAKALADAERAVELVADVRQRVAREALTAADVVRGEIATD
jgi:hypothetical protein